MGYELIRKLSKPCKNSAPHLVHFRMVLVQEATDLRSLISDKASLGPDWSWEGHGDDVICDIAQIQVEVLVHVTSTIMAH